MSYNIDNICNDPAYQNMIVQRTRFQIFNIPPIRYDNLSNNPYEQTNPITGEKFTKFEIDMRRKAEILKYKANKSSTQTNNLTKAEIYAQAVNGKYQQRTYAKDYIVDNEVKSCPVDIKIPSSSSDVPGPIIDLYEDVNVPLYNYNNTMIDTNYGVLTTPYYGKDTWNSNIFSNISSSNNADNTNKLNAIIASIFIYYADVPYKTFSITTPISLHIIGSQSMSFTISKISTNIIFNNNTVSYSTITNTINDNYSQTFNISSSSLPSRTYYLGLLKITNIKLPFQKGFIFDIQTEITFSTSRNVSSTIIFNVEPDPTGTTGDTGPTGTTETTGSTTSTSSTGIITSNDNIYLYQTPTITAT